MNFLPGVFGLRHVDGAEPGLLQTDFNTQMSPGAAVRILAPMGLVGLAGHFPEVVLDLVLIVATFRIFFRGMAAFVVFELVLDVSLVLDRSHDLEIIGPISPGRTVSHGEDVTVVRARKIPP